MMTLEQIRAYQNPVLTDVLMGLGQGRLVGDRLFPRLPSGLSGFALLKLGNAARRRYNLRRAPGTTTKRVPFEFESAVFEVVGYSVDVDVPRELVREFSKATKTLNVPANLELTRIAMETADSILALDYELECADLATTADNYAPGHVQVLSGPDKWGHASARPVTQIKDAAALIHRKTGRYPNCLTLSGDAFAALRCSFEVALNMPQTRGGLASAEDLKTILELEKVEVGESIWVDDGDVSHDVWSNAAVLSYSPSIDPMKEAAELMAEPAFGLTAVLEGHPFAEDPYYEPGRKAWVFGATFERRPYISTPTAGFLFKGPV